MHDQLRGNIMELGVGRKKDKDYTTGSRRTQRTIEGVKWDIGGEKVIKDVLLKVTAP